MIYKNKPKDFNAKFEVVGCFCEYDGKIILLHRQNHKPEGNTWCLPAGKIDDQEDSIQASIREVKEETGIDIFPEQIELVESVYIKFPTYHFVYHTFRAILKNPHDVIINNSEHKDFKWVRPVDALKMNLIEDEDECIKMCYKL